MEISVVKEKGIHTVPVKWLFNGNKYPDILISLKSRSVVKGYMQVPGVYFT